MSRVCLTMIVKNEADVLPRGLGSLRSIIDAWAIVDTGSTDASEAVARSALAGVPGSYVHHPWKDFADARNRSLEVARALGDFLLVMDADDVLEWSGTPVLPALTAACYALRVVHGDTTFVRPHLISSALPCQYVGEVHEYLRVPDDVDVAMLHDPTVRTVGGGCRTKTAGDGKYLNDAAILLRAVERDPTDARSVFYLAQSYHDARNLPEAVRWYEVRADMGGPDDEVFVARWRGARLRGNIHRDSRRCMAELEDVSRRHPQRAEPLLDAARLARLTGDHRRAHALALRAASIARPPHGLFVDPSVYAWRVHAEIVAALVAAGDANAAHAHVAHLGAESRAALVEAVGVPNADHAREYETVAKLLSGSLTG